MRAFRVAAPATTANLGPGYDCLGMALDLWNTIEVEVLPPDSEPSVQVSGEGAGELEPGQDNLVYRSMKFLFDEALTIPTVSIFTTWPVGPNIDEWTMTFPVVRVPSNLEYVPHRK